jgi:hypothetical protein
MKVFTITFYLLLITSLTFAQETEERLQKISKNTVALFHVLKDNPDVKHGLYQVRFKKTIALASGLYDHDKRVGMWHFFNEKGKVMQNYNYDTNTLTYEQPDTGRRALQYIFDRPLKGTDMVTKPIRIGGKYLGYLPYTMLYKKPSGMNYSTESIYVSSKQEALVELLVSPGGNLASYVIHIMDYFSGKQDLDVNINLLNPEDKLFVAATINGEPVASRIIMRCYIDGNNMKFD